jgi:uncharacterized protein (DUF1330 family)
MPAYMVAQYRSTEEYDAYRSAVTALNRLHGARILSKPGTAKALEGRWDFDSMVVIEFESRAAAEAFYSSPAYARVKALRMQAPPMLIVLLDGAETGH